MKKIFLIAALFASYFSGTAQINVSTSTNAGVYVTPPNADPNWVVSGPGLPTPVAAYAVPSYSVYWQPTPIAITNAGWINPKPVLLTDTPGIYTYERSFTIDACVASFACDFGLAWDDVLVGTKIFLVPPTGAAIPITVIPNANHYYLSSNVTTVITSPAAGTWKIRAKIQYIDVLGGFILSGYINTTAKACCCTFANSVKSPAGNKSLKCGTSLSLNCNTTAVFSPALSNCSNPNSHISAVTLTGASGTPSWAINFLSNNGYGNLVIPSGVSGTFTLKYFWGPGCEKCDSCSYTIQINCPGNIAAKQTESIAAIQQTAKHTFVFPNPSTGTFNISLPAGESTEVVISNLYGVILERRNNASGSIQTGSNLRKGFYNLTVTYKDGTKENLKLIKD